MRCGHDGAIVGGRAPELCVSELTELDLSARQCAQSAPQKIRLYDWNRQERMRSLVEAGHMPDRESSGFPTGLHARQSIEGTRTKISRWINRKAESGCCCASLSRDPRSEEYQASPISNSALGWFPACGKPDSSGSHFVAGHGTFRKSFWDGMEI